LIIVSHISKARVWKVPLNIDAVLDSTL
jgi:hypothetical protein